ncbi:MAG: hypothetical protein ABIA92_05645 [Patescibacteria group bacterium]
MDRIDRMRDLFARKNNIFKRGNDLRIKIYQKTESDSSNKIKWESLFNDFEQKTQRLINLLSGMEEDIGQSSVNVTGALRDNPNTTFADYGYEEAMASMQQTHEELLADLDSLLDKYESKLEDGLDNPEGPRINTEENGKTEEETEGDEEVESDDEKTTPPTSLSPDAKARGAAPTKGTKSIAHDTPKPEKETKPGKESKEDKDIDFFDKLREIQSALNSSDELPPEVDGYVKPESGSDLELRLESYRKFATIKANSMAKGSMDYAFATSPKYFLKHIKTNTDYKLIYSSINKKYSLERISDLPDSTKPAEKDEAEPTRATAEPSAEEAESISSTEVNNIKNRLAINVNEVIDIMDDDLGWQYNAEESNTLKELPDGPYAVLVFDKNSIKVCVHVEGKDDSKEITLSSSCLPVLLPSYPDTDVLKKDLQFIENEANRQTKAKEEPEPEPTSTPEPAAPAAPEPLVPAPAASAEAKESTQPEAAVPAPVEKPKSYLPDEIFDINYDDEQLLNYTNKLEALEDYLGAKEPKPLGLPDYKISASLLIGLSDYIDRRKPDDSRQLVKRIIVVAETMKKRIDADESISPDEKTKLKDLLSIPILRCTYLKKTLEPAPTAPAEEVGKNTKKTNGGLFTNLFKRAGEFMKKSNEAFAQSQKGKPAQEESIEATNARVASHEKRGEMMQQAADLVESINVELNKTNQNYRVKIVENAGSDYITLKINNTDDIFGLNEEHIILKQSDSNDSFTIFKTPQVCKSEEGKEATPELITYIVLKSQNEQGV